MAVSVSISKLDALTNKHFVKKLQDNLFLSNALYPYLSKNKEKAHGRDIRIPIRHSRNDTVSRWAGGSNLLDTTGQDNETQAIFPWRFYKGAIVLNGIDVAQNAGSMEQIVDLVAEETENCQDTMMEELDIDSFLTGETTATKTVKGLQGLAAICTYNADPYTSGYGSISRASSTGNKNNPTLNAFWNANQFAANGNTTYSLWRYTVTMDASAVITLAKLQELITVCGDPDVILVGPAIWNKLASLMMTIQRQDTSDSVGKSGFKKLVYQGIPIYCCDNIANSGDVFALTSKHLMIKYLPGYLFEPSPFKKPVNQDTMVKHILGCLNIVCNRPNKQGLMSDATA